MKKHKFFFISFTYWFLLLYIISALVWWFISLEKQNQQMYIYRYEQIMTSDYQYQEKVAALMDARHRKSLQYIGEGLTFFVLIVIGAAYVYRTIRQEIKLADQQQNFMMAITHELKTPIAIAQLNLETMQKRKLEPAQQQRLIQSALFETQRLNTLTSNILTTAQLESQQYNINLQNTDISQLVEKCSKEFQLRYPLRSFHLDIEADIWIKGEQLLLSLLLSNLVDNSIKYDPEKHPVGITLKKHRHKYARLQIMDQGEGISQDEKTRVFTKFYRSGNETMRKTKGTGLGLYLCKRIVEDHHGQISVVDNQPKGAIFTVHFPLLNLK